jgi:anaerobic selenocysteine-containing dehydrogenase
MMYERMDLPFVGISGVPLMPVNWAQLTEPVIAPPQGSDLVEDAAVYWGLAKRLGLQLVYAGEPLDMEAEEPPSTEDLLRIRLRDSAVTFDELKRDLAEHPAGRIYEPDCAVVLPPRPEADGRFDPMPADVAGEVRQLLESLEGREAGPGPGFTHLLSTRRLHQVMNTTGSQLAGTLERMPGNPAYLHPQELEALAVRPGERIEIASAHGAIEAVAQPDDRLRPGVVSIAHCWGGLAGTEAPGVNVNRLIACDAEVQAINAMPRMSAVPVRIRKAPEPA